MRVSVDAPGVRWRLLLIGLPLTGLGLLLLSSRSGLRREFFPGPEGWRAEPVYSDISEPQLSGRQDVADVLVSQEIFHLRWRGWLSVERSGGHRFALEADEDAYLRLGGQELARTSRTSRSSESEVIELEEGLHPLELGFRQTGGRVRLEVAWAPPGDDLRVLDRGALVARRPAFLHAGLQRRLGDVSTSRRAGFIGVVLTLAGAWCLARGLLPTMEAWRRQRSARVATGVSAPGKSLSVLLLLALVVATFLVLLPYTASTTDGDDVRYMDGARFDKQMGWNMNRYAHIYALKLFIWLAEGDAFTASRIYWAFSFAVIVGALAVAAKGLDDGLQLGALGVALTLLFSQTYLFGGIGAAYAEFSAMMFVTLGAAVYLHGARRRPNPTLRGHAVLLGALTVAAAKSKEPGLIMLWLLVGLLWSEGRVDVRLFVRRMGWWVSGAVAAYLVLMCLDGLILGDFWFSLRLESVAGVQRLKQAAEGIWQLPPWAWLQVAWTEGPLRRLSLVAVLAAILTRVRPFSPELRWLAWMPIGFIAMMIAIHPAIGSPRYLFPILPVTCLVGAMAARDLAVASGGWSSRSWLRRGSVAVALIALFGGGLLGTGSSLARQHAAQRGDWTLYPWQVFRREIESARPREIEVSSRLYSVYLMTGQSKTRDRLARLYFQRRHLRLREYRGSGMPRRLALLTRRELQTLRRSHPEVIDRAVFDPSGQIVLLPRD